MSDEWPDEIKEFLSKGRREAAIERKIERTAIGVAIVATLGLLAAAIFLAAQ